MIENKKFTFQVKATSSHARLGEIVTSRGSIRTPAFMPVGTAGTVKAMYLSQVSQLGADIILGNTYHLMLRPGAERVNRLGGLHKFIGWEKPILTDSGGFQVMSLASLAKLTEHSVTFRSHIDGKYFEMSPERSVEIQGLLGSDIQMQLDQCIRLPASEEDIRRSTELSLRWAERSKVAFGKQDDRAIFGIVQGGDIPALREYSAKCLREMDFKGYSIGGLAVGEPQNVMLDMIDIVNAILPQQKPRYLMGVGTPDDIIKAVSRGVDMFDCVMPTRAGRHGLAFTRYGKINLLNSRHSEDPRPLDPESSCAAASQYSRAYLHHLFKVKEMLGAMLLTWNNLHYYQSLMQGIRKSILENKFEQFKEKTIADWKKGDIEAL